MKPETREPSEVAGSTLREHVSAEPDAAAYAVTRSRFIEAAVQATQGERRSGKTHAIAVAAALTLGGMAGWVYLHRSPAPLTFAMGANRTPGAVSKYIVPADGEHLPLYFSDGSVVTLSPVARARVGQTTSQGAAVLVESGALTANVVHRATSDWSFVAGPFNVHVTGTAFYLSWDPSGELEIRMTSGAVVVHGPGAENGIEVRDHRRFLSGHDRRVTRSWTSEAPSSRSETSPTPVEGPRSDDPGAHGSSGDQKAVTHGRELPRAIVLPEILENRTEAPSNSASHAETSDDPWSVLVARGEYARVLAIAERHGMEETLGSANVEDLAALADAARLAGRGTLAERALLQLRARFPGTSRALSAAFLLGRMADDAGNAAGAVSWYERYLGESPNGSLAAEALGRRMMAMRRLNDEESARRAAKDYLERFPNGPHAGIARQMLAR